MLWGAGHYTVFDDEALSCRLYTLPIGEMLRALWEGADPDPPLYYLLQNLWVKVFGVGPLGLRSLSILFFLIGLTAMRAAARTWFDRKTGLVTMLICALHPAHLFFGFAGRWYSLMFLMVAVLLWLSATVSERRNPWWAVIWSAVAAGVCYTNYFGTVIVGLVWLASFWRDRRDSAKRRRWAFAALGSLLLYAIWLAPLWHQVTGFARPESSWSSHFATALRTLIALLTGNLASVSAWWVWAPMLVFGVAFLILMARQWKFVWPIAVVVLGCFTVGVASLTMIDKYIMTFSGPASLLTAVILVSTWRETNNQDNISAAPGRRFRGRWPRFMIGGLAFGWLGCGFNLVMQKHWSSLRWLDPFEEVTAALYEQNWHRNYPDAVISHPSARYYFARLRANDSLVDPFQKKIIPSWTSNLRTDPTDWRMAYEGQEMIDDAPPYYAVTPTAITSRLDASKVDPPPVIITLETPGFVSLPEWEALHAALSKNYELADEPDQYLEDPDAAWKDRLDPNVRHPQWRIVVRYWRLRKYRVD